MSVYPVPELVGGILPSATQLQEIAAQHGMDAATTLLYRRVRESPRHGPFVRRVEEICKRGRSASWDSDAMLVIVPGGFYRENPSSGADGRFLRDQAERLGCPTDLIPINSTGSLQQNAAIICDWLRARRDRPVILASLSKGGADIKMALAQPGAAAAFEHVVGWINLCGTLDGSPLAQWLLSSNPFALFLRTYYRLRGQSLWFMRDLKYGPGSPLDFELRLPSQIRMISIVGFPLHQHLSNAVARSCYRRLAPLGPNDGGLVLADVCAQPGLLYPLWGADHYLRPKTDVRELISAILQYLAEELR
jgi:hypothetical protein